MAEQPTQPARVAGAGQAGGRSALYHPAVRRGAAGVTAGLLVVLVVCDQLFAPVRSWWDAHSFTSCVVSSLLVLGIAALIVDEVVARRQRRERAGTVAVQALIVYGQARRAYEAVVAHIGAAGGTEPGVAVRDAAGEEVRSLANMILVASPSLFEDPEARQFLEEVQQLAAAMYVALALPAAASRGLPGDLPVANGVLPKIARLKEHKARLDARMAPLAARLPKADQAPFEDLPDLGAPRVTLGDVQVGRR